MFEPELFGVEAAQYRELAVVLFTPTVGFLFLYLLNRPLKSLPLVDVPLNFTPPKLGRVVI